MNTLILLVCSLLFALLGAAPGAALGALIGVPFGATGNGALIGASLGALLVGGRAGYWYVQGFRLQNIGYIPPGPSTVERILYYWLCRALLRVLLGPVIVIGRENAHYEGRLGCTSTHQHGFDFLIARLAVPFAFRQIGAAKEVKGWRAGPAAFGGTFAIPVMGGKSTDHSGSDVVIDNCARLLKQSPRRRVLVFIQGKLVYDNVLRPGDFRTGLVRMLGKVDEWTDHEPSAILPSAIHYWDEHDCPNPNIGRRFMVWLFNRCFPDYGGGPKYGATIVVGAPMPFGSLSPDPRAATEQVRVAMVGLLEQAKAATPKPAV